MEKETFGVELELITSKFSQKMETIKSKINNFGKITKQNFNIGMHLNIETAKRDLASLKQELISFVKSKDNFVKPIKIDFDTDGNLNLDESSLKKLSTYSKESLNTIEKLLTQIQSLSHDIKTFETGKIAKLGQAFSTIKAPIDKIKTSIKTSKNGMNEFSSSVNKTFKKGIASVKRFALSLFGIQTIWRAVSRASSAYLSQDVELSNKLQAVWIGLGSLLAPLLEKISNFFLKLVGYLNVFIRTLTNVDLLANAMAKANSNTKATSNSLKQLKGQLSGFDEINNIADNNADTDTVNTGTGWTDAFSNIQLDTSWTEIITNFGNWMKDNWPIVVGLIGGTAVALELVKLGVKGITSLGIGVILAGIVYSIHALISYIKDPSWENFGKILTGIGVILAGFAIIIGGWPLAVAAAITLVLGIILQNWEKIKTWLKTAENWIYDKFINPIEKKFGLFGQFITEPIKLAIDTAKKLFGGLFTGIKQILDGIIQIFKGNFKAGIVSVFKGIGNICIACLNTLINGLNAVISPIRLLIVAVGKVMGKNWSMSSVKIPTIPKLDTGTNFVPNDQLAYIHKGEAVVPKKFNSDIYFNRGNDETNDLLRELIETIENKDTDIYLDASKIGESTRKYLVNQKRIMGRSVV